MLEGVLEGAVVVVGLDAVPLEPESAGVEGVLDEVAPDDGVLEPISADVLEAVVLVASLIVPSTVVVSPVTDWIVVEAVSAAPVDVLVAVVVLTLGEVVAMAVFVVTKGLDEVLALLETLITVMDGVVVAVAQWPAVAARIPLTTRIQNVPPVPASVVSMPFLTVAFSASRVCVWMSLA